jgi:hypothetical protein
MKKGVAEKRLRPKLRFYFSNRNRHLAEWRFLLFTVTVIVYPKIWKVNVIGIAAPPFRECDGTAFLRLATPALAGDFIVQSLTGFVNQKRRCERDSFFPGIFSSRLWETIHRPGT